jgi:hypothetical protein
MDKYRKFLILFLSIFCLLVLANGVILATDSTETNLELVYPNLSTFANPPSSSQAYLPTYIQYIYSFAVFGGGLIAFLVLLVGGVRFLTSVGNPGTMQDARDQIFSGIIGLVVILGSFVLLREINPTLTSFSLPQMGSSGNGIIIYSDGDCGKGADGAPFLSDFTDKNGKSTVQYMFIGNTKTNLVKKKDEKLFTINSFYAFHSSTDMNVSFYNTDDCSKDPKGQQQYKIEEAQKCVRVVGGIENVRCIKIDWRDPGVWLFTYADGNPLKTKGLSDEAYKNYKTSQDVLPPAIKDKVRSVALMNSKENNFSYGAILHANPPSAAGGNRGWARILLPVNGYDITSYNLTGSDVNVGSITVFRIPKVLVATTDKFVLWRENAGTSVIDNNGNEIHPKIEIGWNTKEKLEDITNKICSGAKASSLNEAANSEEVFNGTSQNDCGYSADTPIVGAINVLDLKWMDDDGNEANIKNNTVVYGKDAGVSGFKMPEGEDYVALLFKNSQKTADFTSLESLVKLKGADKSAAVLYADESDLTSIRWNEYLGALVAVRTNSEY